MGHLAALDWLLIALYFGLVLGVGWRTRSRPAVRETSSGYFLAGRNVGWFVVGAALFASNIGSEHLVGLAGTGYGSGVAVAQFEVLASLVLLVLGWLFVPFYLRSGVFTVPEFLERRYSAGARSYLAGISIVGYVLTKISVTLYAGGIVYEVLIGGSFWTGAVVVVLATGLYTVLGGLRAVLYTETIQMFLLVGGAVLVTVIGLSEIGGWGALTRSVEASFFDMWLPASHPEFPWTGILLGAPILGIWYWCTDQFIVQRTLSARGIDHARRGTIFAGFLKLLPLFVFVVPGIVARALEQSGRLSLDRADHALPELVRVLLPVGIRGLVVAGFLAALMSSLAAVFNACSTLITFDVYRRLRPRATESQLVWVGKLSSGVLVLLGLAWIPFMPYVSSHVYVYLQSVQAYIAPPIAAVFLLGLAWPRVNAQGALAALGVGFVLGIARLVLELNEASLHGPLLWFASINFLHVAALLFAVCTATLVIVSLATPRPPAAATAGLTLAQPALEARGDASDPAWRRRDVWLSAALAICVAGVWILFGGGCGPTAAAGSDVEERGAPRAGQAYLTAFDAEIDRLLRRMTLDEKVGQMTQADLSYLEDPSDVAAWFLGSVLSGGGSDPAAGNGPRAWRETVLDLQRHALSTRLGIPLLYGTDAVHGHSNVRGAVIFPHHVGLGAAGDPRLVEEVYRATARELRATGIPWSFAPSVAVARDIRWGRNYESFSEDPELVARLGAAAVRGLQDPDGAGPGVIACAKHYVGDGGTAFGTGAPREAVPDSVFEGSGGRALAAGAERFPLDRGDARIGEPELRAVHLRPYLAALDAGVATIMVSFSSWNGERMSASRHLLTDVLKRELGFEGFLVSDWAAIDDIPGSYRSDVATSINAGMDMVMVPDRYQEFFRTLLSLVRDGTVPRERIDDAVRRILRVKFAAGLMDPGWRPEPDPALLGEIGSPAHRALARRAVRASLVLLKNEGGTLPLAKDARRIHVVGKNADDLGHQCGGWTIDWQGASGDVTEGTTILEAIRAAVAPGTEVTYARDGSGAEGADAVVAVVGETPYAEMLGDRGDLSLDAEDMAAIEASASAGVPLVTVVVSGRPLVLGEALERSTALVAAWLPGSEGAGVADVLFGDHPPGGKLPFSWPRGADSLPHPRGQEPGDPLFPSGFGLGY